MAVFLTIGAITLIMQPEPSVFSLVPLFVQQMAVGGILGYGIGRITAHMINVMKLEYEGLYAVFTLAMALITYSLTTALGGNGFLAVYIAGMVIGNSAIVHKRTLIRFHEGVGWLMQIILFLTLGLFVFPSQLVPIIVPGIIISILLIFIARPIAVYLSLIPWKMKKNEKVLISWVGLRGAAPIVLATFPLLYGVPGGQVFFNMVFFMVIASSLLHGTSIPFIARALGLSAPLPPKSRFNMEIEPREDDETELIELIMRADSPAIDKQIVSLGLPDGTLIILIAKGKDQFSPCGSTVLEEGDVLLVLTSSGQENEIREMILGPSAITEEPTLDIPEGWFNPGRK
jgi:cell volume regulation protein A